MRTLTLSAILSFFAVFCFLSLQPLRAEEADQKYKYGVKPIDIDTYEIFDGRKIDLPPAASIDPAFMDEMQYAYAACVSDPLRYAGVDCGCRAKMFLKHRLEMPEAHKMAVYKEANKTHCYIPEKLQEKYDSMCRHSLMYKRLGDKGDSYCTCYSQKVTPQVVELEAGPGYGGKLKRIETMARKECRP